jgi:hypothetical protein
MHYLSVKSKVYIYIIIQIRVNIVVLLANISVFFTYDIIKSTTLVTPVLL